MSKKNKQPKEPKENKEPELTVYDIIACGTFVTSVDKFYDHLYAIYPELSREIVTINTFTTHRFSTEEEKQDLFNKDKSKFTYAIFTPETLREKGMLKISSNLQEEIDNYKTIIPDSRADAIVEIERTGKNNAILKWHLIER